MRCSMSLEDSPFTKIVAGKRITDTESAKAFGHQLMVPEEGGGVVFSVSVLSREVERCLRETRGL